MRSAGFLDTDYRASHPAPLRNDDPVARNDRERRFQINAISGEGLFGADAFYYVKQDVRPRVDLVLARSTVLIALF